MIDRASLPYGDTLVIPSVPTAPVMLNGGGCDQPWKSNPGIARACCLRESAIPVGRDKILQHAQCNMWIEGPIRDPQIATITLHLLHMDYITVMTQLCCCSYGLKSQNPGSSFWVAGNTDR